MKKCSNCGGPNSNNEIYCDYCGELLPDKKVNFISQLFHAEFDKSRNKYHIMRQNFLKKINRFCIFHIWVKFLFFFITFLFILIPTSVGVYWVFKTNIMQAFFTDYNISNAISGLQNTSINSTALQNSLLGTITKQRNLSDLAILVGAIVGYCAFFEYVKKWNLFDSIQTNDYARILNFFTYAFFASILYDCIIIGGFFQGWFNPVSNDQKIEIVFLFVMVFIACLNIIIAYYFHSKKNTIDSYEDLVKNAYFLENINYSSNFQIFSIYVFFLTITLPFFGDALSFNILSILFIDLQLIYIISVLGFINSIPTQLSIIQFKSGDSINDAFLINDSKDDSIIILTSENQQKKIMKDSILWMSINDKISLKDDRILHIGDKIFVKTGECLNLSKISWPFLLIFSIFSIILGLILKLIVIILPFSELFIFTIVLIILCLFLLVLVGWVVNYEIKKIS